MQESAAVVDSGMKASGAARCKTLLQQIDLAERIRESFARCEEPKERTSSVRDADEVIEASLQALNKWCPSRPGMVRVRMTMVEHVTTTDLLLAERVFIGDKPDLILMFWDPAKSGVCGVHAIWRVSDGKAALVFWG